MKPPADATEVKPSPWLDLKRAVESAAQAHPVWQALGPGQRCRALHRLAGAIETRRDALVNALRDAGAGRVTAHAARREVDVSRSRLISFAGWADKIAAVLGSTNSVEGPYTSVTVVEPRGVIGVIGPHHPPLLGLISLLAPPLCVGNGVVALVSESLPQLGLMLKELCRESGLPAGTVNVIIARRADLIDHFASHESIDALHAATNSRAESRSLKRGRVTNFKRVIVHDLDDETWFDDDACESPWLIEPFVTLKTIWHPSAT